MKTESNQPLQASGIQATLRRTSQERTVRVPSGWWMLGLNVLLALGAVAWLIENIRTGVQGSFSFGSFIGSVLLCGVAGLMCSGHFTLQPNQARVLILFGAYCGTVKQSGFHWANPFYSRRTTISLRAHNAATEKLKVNDKRGNPIEIAAVVVWQVEDTAKALFDVEDYHQYVDVQSEAAVRQIASAYAYDPMEEEEVALRSHATEVAAALREELQRRLAIAGVVVLESRITHLAYAPEIAQAMLRRQQAEAVIAARQKIVQGAVSMVEMALHDLAARHVVDLDDDRRAAMVSNLLVVLCGEAGVTPVINAGTLYT
ncbi:MAG: SPFH domain-containing protein [Verrucomicrobiota bacterium]|nr:SPFH domain-containing protein [Limisphaera sp.]MDW8380912.1 SPFH domain-containing protein [Verrucomicrobiota bacterium]